MIKRQAPLFIMGLLTIMLIFTFGRRLIQYENPADIPSLGTKNTSEDSKSSDNSALKADLKTLGFSGDLNIRFNQSEIKFSREPQIFNQEVYVPVSELSGALGFYVKLELDQYLILYKNNTFIKLDLESNLASINGKSYDLDSGPYYSDQRIYVPFLFLMDAFKYNVAWDKASGRIDLADDSSTGQFDFIDEDNYFKRIEIGDLGIRVSVPVHWDLLDEKARIYGYTDDFEYFTMAIKKEKVGSGDDFETYASMVEKDLKKKYSKNFQVVNIDKSTSTLLESYAIKATLKEGNENYQIITYLFKENQQAYSLEFKFSEAMDEASCLKIIGATVSSFQINQLSIQEREEHYVEFSKFYQLGVKLKDELYANKTTDDAFMFEGTLNSNIDGFNVKVSKESQTISFFVPVKNRSFSQKIYLPFGLGKHNIYVEIAESGGLFQRKPSDQLFEPLITSDEDNILQFSMVNVSSNKIRYLIPSSRVPSNEKKMSDLANLLTYDSETSYKKAKALYHWIEQNIRFDVETEKDKLRSPIQVFDNSVGTEEELAYFYATLLRSLQIPCRIVSGDYNGESHFWNELLINGKWIVADLGEEFNKGDGITTYFNLTRDEHYSDYRNIKVLEY